MSATTALQRFYDAVGEYLRGDVRWTPEALAVHERLFRALLVHSPFSRFSEAMLINGSGGATGAENSLQGWLDHQARANANIDSIVAEVDRETQRNQVEVLEVSYAHGVVISDTIDLSQDAFLCRNKALPDTIDRRDIFLSKDRSGRSREELAALVQKVSISPVICPKNSDQYKVAIAKTRKDVSMRREFRQRIRSALLLLSRHAVEFPWQYIAAEPRKLLAFNGSGGGRSIEHVVYNVHFADARSTVEMLNSINSFKNFGLIELAIDRVGRARLIRDPINNTIDYGMALEIALMAGAKNNAEISHKLRMRGAWLLGDSPNERRLAALRIEDIYDARSKAVHTGVIKKPLDLFQADEFVTSLLKKIVSGGRFPNWDDLVLGLPHA